MNEKTKVVVGLGLITAVVVVLQLFASGIRLGPFSITLALAPIIVGAALYGASAGAWLGLVFSVVVLFMDSAAFMAISIPGTIATVLLKGTLAGLAAGLVYTVFSKRSSLIGVIAAGITAPIVNTGIFVIGCYLFFYDTVSAWGEGLGFANPTAYIFLGMIGGNFIVEFLVNMALSAAIVQIIEIGKKQLLVAEH